METIGQMPAWRFVRWLLLLGLFWDSIGAGAKAASAQEAEPPPISTPATAAVYTVQPGDTLLSVSIELGVDLQDISCLVGPFFSWDQPLVIGDSLELPALPFACHRAQAGESLGAIASAYGVPVAWIVQEAWNGLRGEPVPGQWLRIPLAPPQKPTEIAVGGALPVLGQWSEFSVTERPLGPSAGPETAVPADWPFGSGQFAWPAYGWLTQTYHSGHRAIDIAAPVGTLVTAADRGVVIRAGWSRIGYGNFVVIDHKIDYLTLYAHLSELFVQEGQVVAKGQALGLVGSTGNSTGPHLHFEIRDFGHRVDPLGLLAE